MIGAGGTGGSVGVRLVKRLAVLGMLAVGCSLAVISAPHAWAGRAPVSVEGALETLGFIVLKNDPSAPDFTLQDPFGQSIRLADQRGKVVFLTFWTTW